jgi:uncharacterized protein
MTHHEHPNVTLVREAFAAFERGDMARMDQLLTDDVVWHVGGNSKWAGTYEGKAKVLEYFGRQAQATETAAEIHDILGNDEHVVVLGTAKATAQDGSSAEWKYTQIFHIRDGKATEVWGMAENDAAVDPFLNSLPTERRQGPTPASHRGVARRGGWPGLEVLVRQQAPGR